MRIVMRPLSVVAGTMATLEMRRMSPLEMMLLGGGMLVLLGVGTLIRKAFDRKK
jgi:hypothetical protein